MKLIYNWREAPRWYSVWALSAATTVGGITAYLPASALVSPVLFFPAWTWGSLIGSVVAFFGVTGLLGRLISQD